jgi:hypothetical protein
MGLHGLVQGYLYCLKAFLILEEVLDLLGVIVWHAYTLPLVTKAQRASELYSKKKLTN